MKWSGNDMDSAPSFDNLNQFLLSQALRKAHGDRVRARLARKCCREIKKGRLWRPLFKHLVGYLLTLASRSTSTKEPHNASQ